MHENDQLIPFVYCTLPGLRGTGGGSTAQYREGGVGEAGEKRAEEGSSKGREAEKQVEITQRCFMFRKEKGLRRGS